MRPINTRILACALLLSCLSACGFHLRQDPALPAQMRTIYISGGEGDLARYLRRDLATDKTQIVDDLGLATSVLRITGVGHHSTLLAISSAGVPLEYKVYYEAEFSLMVGNAMLIEPQKLVLTRTYNYNIADAIGNQEQEEALYGAMAVDMAQLIVFRIQAAARSATQMSVTVTAPAKATLRPPAAAMQPSAN